jgi:hypothetical protein
MTDHLAGQVIKQIGMVIVGDIIEIDQPADHVILQPHLFDTAFAQGQDFHLPGAQMLDPQFI